MLMRRGLISIFLVVALLLTAVSDRAQQPPQPAPPTQTPPSPGQQQPPEQSPQRIIQVVNLVDVLFTVLNRRNKLVPDLEKDDFKIFDEKTAQEIRYFSKQTDLPLRIGMLIDTSNSIRDRIKFEQDASTNFLFSVLRRGRDEAFAMTFDDEPQIIQSFSSDGDDNLSNHTRSEAIEMAQRTSVVIYSISTSTQWIQLSQTDPLKLADRKTHLTEGDKILQELAEETGGRAFFPYHVDDLDQSFKDIGDELRNQYSIAYIPTHSQYDGKYHRIRIEVPEHKGYQVRARRGYFAKANTGGSAGTNPSGTGN